MQRMLAELRRIDPSAALRLAPTLRLLRVAVAAFLRTYGPDTLTHLSRWDFPFGDPGRAIAGPTRLAETVPPIPSARASALGTGVFVPETVEQASPQPDLASTDVARTSHRRVARPSTAVAAAAPAMATTLHSATTAPASGSAPASTPASGALLIAIAVFLRYAMSSGRLALGVLPWRSALLVDPLDRPG